MKLPEIKQFLEKNKSNFPNDIRLNTATLITDIEKFFKSHIDILEGDSTKQIKMLFYNRLMMAIEIIKS